MADKITVVIHVRKGTINSYTDAIAGRAFSRAMAYAKEFHVDRVTAWILRDGYEIWHGRGSDTKGYVFEGLPLGGN